MKYTTRLGFALLATSLIATPTLGKILDKTDVIEVYNAQGSLYPIVAYAKYTTNGGDVSIDSAPISPGGANFIPFNVPFGNLTSDITIQIKDVYGEGTYTCQQKVKHDATGPQGNWMVNFDLSLNGFTCQVQPVG